MRTRTTTGNGTLPPQPRPAIADETSAQKFKRLGDKRVPAAVNAIRLCGNLADYDHSDVQATKIIAALTNAVSGVENRFERNEEELEFSL